MTDSINTFFLSLSDPCVAFLSFLEFIFGDAPSRFYVFVVYVVNWGREKELKCFVIFSWLTPSSVISNELLEKS